MSEPLQERSANVAAIRIRDLVYTVDGYEILRGISVDVQKGEILCVVGLSGGGKSTLLRCVSGLIPATQGSITIDAVEIVGLNEQDLLPVRARMGVVFQYAALFDSMNVFQNIAFGMTRGYRSEKTVPHTKTALIRRVAELLHDVGLPGIERRMPDELSGGMRRRVGLARTLATEPSLVLYDEPTSGLDPVTAASIDDLIVEMRDKKGVTSIVVSHDMASVLRIADNVLFLYDGKVEFYGTPSAMRQIDNPIVEQFIAGRSTGPIQIKKQ